MTAYLLAALSGALYVLAYPGIDLWPLAFVALVPLLHALHKHVRSGWQALLVGLCFGAIAQLGTCHWLLPTLHAFSGQPMAVCVLVFLLFGLYQGGQHALFAWLLWRGARRGFELIALAPFCYGALEWLYPLFFPGYFAGSVHDVLVVTQVADLGGPTLISMLLTACNASLYGLMRLRLGGAAVPPRSVVVSLALLACALSYGALRVPMIDGASARAEKLRVGIVQVNMGLWQKRKDREEGRKRHIEQSRELEQQSPRPELLIWPETALQYALPFGMKDARPLLGALVTPVLFGGLGQRIAHGKTLLYNSAFLADASGRVLGRTDKVRLIPMAEYMPLGERFPQLYSLSDAGGRFEHGSGAQALSFRKHRIAALICYEDLLPDHVRDVMTATDPELLVNLTNDAWFGDSAEPRVHLALARLRAIEQRRYLVRATATGVSAIVDPVGRIVAQSGVLVRQNLRGEVAWLTGHTVYGRFGDWPGWLGLGVALCGSWGGRRRKV